MATVVADMDASLSAIIPAVHLQKVDSHRTRMPFCILFPPQSEDVCSYTHRVWRGVGAHCPWSRHRIV